jgi:hypothetical protein
LGFFASRLRLSLFPMPDSMPRIPDSWLETSELGSGSVSDKRANQELRERFRGFAFSRFRGFAVSALLRF